MVLDMFGLRPRRPRRKVLGRLEVLGARAGGPVLAPEAGAFHQNDGPHYLDVLAALHGVLAPQWYLEIGTRSGRSLALAQGNFVAIDPEFGSFAPPLRTGTRGHFFAQTSDDFFAGGFLAREGIRPDLGFLDGMHLSEFLMRDLMHFERAARPGAVAVLHDCLPCTHAMETRDPAAVAQGKPWTGDVWKVLWWLVAHRPDLRVQVLDAWPTGLVVIEGLDPANTVLPDSYDRFVAELGDVRLTDFGVTRFFDAFPIQSAFRYVEGLKNRTAPSQGEPQWSS